MFVNGNLDFQFGLKRWESWNNGMKRNLWVNLPIPFQRSMAIYKRQLLPLLGYGDEALDPPCYIEKVYVLLKHNTIHKLSRNYGFTLITNTPQTHARHHDTIISKTLHTLLYRLTNKRRPTSETAQHSALSEGEQTVWHLRFLSSSSSLPWLIKAANQPRNTKIVVPSFA